LGRFDASGTNGAMPKAVAPKPASTNITPVVRLRWWREIQCAAHAVAETLMRSSEANDFNSVRSVALGLQARVPPGTRYGLSMWRQGVH
jgi:hypothetical protein